MNCFTVVEREILKGFSVIGSGIGMEGKLATIADGINFPKPEITEEVQEVNDQFPYQMPNNQVILKADYFQYQNNDTGKLYTPIILKPEHDHSGSALVLWTVGISGSNFFDNPILRNSKIVVGPIPHLGYNQYLFKMESRDSSIIVKTDTKYISLSYGYGKLNIISR